MKKTVSTIIDDIKKGRRTKSKRFKKNSPLEIFNTYLDDALWISLYALNDDSKSSITEKRLAISNLIVNQVTAIEVYFRNIIIYNSRWSSQGIEALMKEKITLADAYNLLKKGNVRLENIIAETFPFNDLTKIGSTMQALTCCSKDFWIEVQEHEVDTLDSDRGVVTLNFVDLYPDWRKDLESMYVERNRYIHEGILSKQNVNSTINLNQLIKHLAGHTSQYLSEVWKIKS